MRHNIIDISRLFHDKRTWIYLFAFSVTIFVFLVGLYFSDGQKIPTSANKLIVIGHNKLTTNEIINFLKIKPGVSFENYDLNILEKKLKENQRIKSVSITRKSKDQLLISLVEKKTKFIIHSQGQLFEIDEDLEIFSTNDVREFGVPIVSGDFPILNNKIKSPAFNDLFGSISESFEAYPSLQDRTSEIYKNKDGEIFFYIHYPRPITVQIGTVLDKKQIRKMYASLAYFENQNKQVSFLDLRGDDAVYH